MEALRLSCVVVKNQVKEEASKSTALFQGSCPMADITLIVTWLTFDLEEMLLCHIL